jgi:hypothetical protein
MMVLLYINFNYLCRTIANLNESKKHETSASDIGIDVCCGVTGATAARNIVAGRLAVFARQAVVGGGQRAA